MSGYSALFDGLGLRDWCDTDKKPSLLSLRSLKNEEVQWHDIKFPSLDNLHEACARIPQTRDFTAGLEDGFLAIRPALRWVLDPLTQPLSWMLDATLYLFTSTPWWLLVPILTALCYFAARSKQVVALVLCSFAFFLFIDHYEHAVQTLAIIFVCTLICVLMGVPLGIWMSKSDRVQRMMTPVLDMLQTLPTFVYLIPLIFLFKITEPKLYGMAIIMYAIVPVVRLTNLGIRLVDQSVIEAANAYGLTPRQRLWGVEIPLALPNIMAGVNQTIMMSLAMVVIASLVSAPGLGTLVLDGINNLRLGVGFVAGFAIVVLAILLDRVSKTALNRVNAGQSN